MMFACDNCDKLDSVDLVENALTDKGYLCSQCNPSSNGWHGLLPEKQYDPENDIVINRVPPGGNTIISLD